MAQWVLRVELPDAEDHRALAEALREGAKALDRIAAGYVDVEPADTSPLERQMMARAVALVDTALEQLS